MKRLCTPAATLALSLCLSLLAGCSTLPGWMIVQGRSGLGDARHFDNASIARSATPRPLPAPAQPVTLRWPGDWASESVEAWLAEQDTVALVVLRRGELVYERYFNGYDRERAVESFSVAKSVVSAMLGIAISEGRIAGVDEPVTRWLPELAARDARFAQIRLRHLLSMRSGIRFNESYGNPFSEAAYFYLGPDLKAQVARLEIAGPPDQAYHYSSGDTQLLSMVVERAMGAPFAALVQQRLWQPMGAGFDASWSLDSAAGGVARGFCCLNARALDYARFGQLFLDGGAVGGRQVVPADWVRASTRAQDGLPGADAAARLNLERPGTLRAAFYAWQWRRLPEPAPAATPAEALRPGGSFFAQGLHGQYIVVVPETQTVVVRLGRSHGQVVWPRWLDRLARLNP